MWFVMVVAQRLNLQPIGNSMRIGVISQLIRFFWVIFQASYLDGTVIDYFKGMSDLEKRRIAFVGDATQRIQEDYLRILRYFRFFGRLAPCGDAHEKETLDAIVANKSGMKDISGERIWSELKKICVGRLGGEVITTMLKQCGLALLLGLPENADTAHFCQMHRRFHPNIEAMTLLTSCKLSHAEKSLAEFIMQHRDAAEKDAANDVFFKNVLLHEERLHKFTRKKVQTSREKVIELAKYAMSDDRIINEIRAWETPVFPVSGLDLMHSNVPSGQHVKKILDHLFKLWIESQWKMDQEELLKHIDDIEWRNEKSRSTQKRKHSFEDR
ncbi:unnamed protein product [Gongylonema pulchrum]|uniref:PolyA_pol_RNAbd domain-containing protein n=1 Tax=Gongylonema pulchrum TaxID=637853 RepID=A0A183DXR4_9BILA|nr:unnamed protein product [Gongylonema pulchrum]